MPTRYDKEFKQNIINLYKQGESAAQLAREYGIGYSIVHKWIQGQAKTQSGKSPDEIKAMEKQLASLSFSLDGMLCKHHFSKNRQVFFHIFWVVTLIMQSRHQSSLLSYF